MQDKYLYEYAVIRVVPRVEREEFLNVGVIMYSKRAKYLKARYQVNEEKLRLFSSELEIDSLYANLKTFDLVCSGNRDGGQIAMLDIPERYRWLTATRSTSIQTSVSRQGFSGNLDETFEKLFEEYVL